MQEGQAEILLDRYRGRLIESAGRGAPLVFDITELERFDIEVADFAIEHPDEFLQMMNRAVNGYDFPIEVDGQIRVRIRNARDVRRIGSLRSTDVGRLITVEGIVRSASVVYTSLTEVYLVCRRCQTGMYAPAGQVKRNDGLLCVQCERSGPFKIDRERSKKDDSRFVVLQEFPEGLRAGNLPRSILVILSGDLVENIGAGNRVRITGVLKLMEGPKSKASETIDYDHYIEAVYVEQIERDFEDLVITDDDVEQIKRLSQEPDLIEKIRRSIAPSIYGLDDIKLAIALQLASAPETVYADGTTSRGDIHVLLVGDPGVAKSQLLRYVAQIAPRAVFTSGKGVTVAGLTAAAVKDETGDGKWTIEAGALPLADKGVCCIDELDKMNERDREALHEGLEQQIIAIAKAGITATLRCRCAVLAAANPKYGRFDPNETVAAQINLPPTLLSRFDLIFVIHDRPDQARDGELVEHILNGDAAAPAIEPDLLRKYIAYVRQSVNPVLTDDAKAVLKKCFLDVRGMCASANHPVPITARQLQALMRLSKAVARLRMSKTVSEGDARLAANLLMKCLGEVGIDPESGMLDVGTVDVGMTKTAADRTITLQRIIADLAKRSPDRLASHTDVIAEAERAGIDIYKAENLLRKMVSMGSVMEVRAGKYRPV
ncbi:MAG TPA: minichromosome maintenance protein MCM [Methanothrix sp.]|nr:minichromosome maintenance protein MCM [Methanothrix sp.]